MANAFQHMAEAGLDSGVESLTLGDSKRNLHTPRDYFLHHRPGFRGGTALHRPPAGPRSSDSLVDRNLNCDHTNVINRRLSRQDDYHDLWFLLRPWRT